MNSKKDSYASGNSDEHGVGRCAWHDGERPIEEDEDPGCQNCGMLHATRFCDGCGGEFLDWEARGYDDVIAGPYATCSGDLYCTRCGPRADREMERAESEDFGGYYDAEL